MDELDRFFGGGGRALKFPTKGTSHTLHITGEPEVAQQTDFDTGEPMFWPDGRPKNQVIVPGTVTQGLEGPDDDGNRRLYIKGYMQNAVSAALKAVGAKVPEAGGVLTVTYSQDGQKQGRRQPPKLYTATYTPPSPVAEALSGGSTQHEDVPAQRGGRKAATVPATPDDEEPPF
ncbi:MAG: hypothetical protein ACRDRY_21245 [Pseudonocardiaceae bacterium]